MGVEQKNFISHQRDFKKNKEFWKIGKIYSGIWQIAVKIKKK